VHAPLPLGEGAAGEKSFRARWGNDRREGPDRGEILTRGGAASESPLQNSAHCHGEKDPVIHRRLSKSKGGEIRGTFEKQSGSCNQETSTSEGNKSRIKGRGKQSKFSLK